MKFCFFLLLTIIVFINYVGKVKGDCDPTEALKCTSDYKRRIANVGNDQHRYCTDVYAYLECLAGIGCLTRDIRDRIITSFEAAGIKCGAASLSMSFAFITTTVFVTLKNII